MSSVITVYVYACVHTVGCHTVSLLLSVCSSCVCLLPFKGVCVLAHTYNPLIQRYGVSTAVLNNAKSLRLTTE